MALTDLRFNWVIRDARGDAVDRVQWQKDAEPLAPGSTVAFEPAPMDQALADYARVGMLDPHWLD